MDTKKIDELKILFASVYTLYLNTQSAHWQVKGPSFYSLHMLFEKEYQAIALQVDALAELIVMNDVLVPANFADIIRLSAIENFASTSNANVLLTHLINGNEMVIKLITQMLDAGHDENINAMLTDLLAYYEKELWMLKASK
jgi:starvation-inducible DNA-binding protein